MTLVRFVPGTRNNNWNTGRVDLLDHFFGLQSQGEEAEKASWTPRADVAENGDGFQLTIELPGLNKGDINIKFEDEVLTIDGERPVPGTEDRKLLRRENHYGKFSRSFRVGNQIDVNKIAATYLNGLLTVNLPKAEEAKPREIKITANGRSK